MCELIEAVILLFAHPFMHHIAKYIEHALLILVFEFYFLPYNTQYRDIEHNFYCIKNLSHMDKVQFHIIGSIFNQKNKIM